MRMPGKFFSSIQEYSIQSTSVYPPEFTRRLAACSLCPLFPRSVKSSMPKRKGAMVSSAKWPRRRRSWSSRWWSRKTICEIWSNRARNNKPTNISITYIAIPYLFCINWTRLRTLLKRLNRNSHTMRIRCPDSAHVPGERHTVGGVENSQPIRQPLGQSIRWFFQIPVSKGAEWLTQSFRCILRTEMEDRQ